MKQQLPLTAVLGDLGAPDSSGFTGESTLPTRQITVTDASGAIVYSKRTNDTAKAADSHIRNIKYRRSGEWVDGVATVEPIPAAVTNKKRMKAALITAAAVALVWIFLATSFAAAPNAAKETCQEKVTGLLPAGAAAKFKDMDARTDHRTFNNGLKEWRVAGKVTTADLSGEVRDIPFTCSAELKDSNVYKTKMGTMVR